MNLQFSIESTVEEKVRKGESRFTMAGAVIAANNPANIGVSIKIIAQTVVTRQPSPLPSEIWFLKGAGLVVTAIIAILIGMLLPAVQKVR